MPFFGAADGVAAVPAGIDDTLGTAIVIAHNDDSVPTNKGHEEVTRIENLRVVAHEVLGPRENAL